MIKLAYLAPSITQVILEGTQPSSLTLADLRKHDVRIGWADQRRCRNEAEIRRMA